MTVYPNSLKEWKVNKLPTKANVLGYLRGRLRNSIIDPLLFFTVTEWQAKQDEILDRMQSVFPGVQRLLVRSSAVGEDNLRNSLAGHYHTEPDICADDIASLTQAIGRVISSYSRNNRVPNPEDQVIVQFQVDTVAVSGVVLTRDSRSGAPYYVINYDGGTGLTDTVTQGLTGKALWLACWRDAETLPCPWRELVLAVQEIEQLFHQEVLDIEFGVDHSNHIHIFQVRPFAVKKSLINDNDRRVRKVVDRLKTDLKRLTSDGGNLSGSRTILADMPDWNPAEIIGGRPNVLDYSLYRFLVTKSAWNEARVSMGYTDVVPSELMVVLGNKPYVDTRVSFNSLTPAGLSQNFREALIDYYLDKLADHPELQDKVEFAIVFTCFDLSFDDRICELKESGFSRADVAHLRQHLLSFTNDLLLKSTSIVRNDLRIVQQLENSLDLRSSVYSEDTRTLLDQAYRLLTRCRQGGVIPFSRMARLAFVGLAIFKNLRKQRVVSDSFFDDFLSSIETVAKDMSRDFCQLAQGAVSMESFMKKYGHLRPGTYNIQALRYDQRPDLFADLKVPNQQMSYPTKFVVDQVTLTRIGETWEKHGIQYSAQALLDFIRQAIEGREYSKFVFTKSLSDAIELIALAGEQMGFSRDELALIDLDTLLEARSSTSLDLKYVKDLWAETISKNRGNRSIYEKIALPPVVTHTRDLEAVSYYESCPNFVTQKQVEGKLCFLSSSCSDNHTSVTSKIVLLENADPGYDWIFTRHPKGLITKYGGAGSHMAIRCAEFDLPAAIGCGEVIFDRLSRAHRVLINCRTEAIIPM
jgi:hypothetical protein